MKRVKVQVVSMICNKCYYPLRDVELGLLKQYLEGPVNNYSHSNASGRCFSMLSIPAVGYTPALVLSNMGDICFSPVRIHPNLNESTSY